MKRILFFCFVLGSWIYPISLRAQSDLGFRTFNYTTENGLPSNGIKGLQWDEESGFLWIATEAGISRFNGIEFVNFTRSNTSFISSERMRFMARNRKGGIRVVDMDGNILGVSKNRPIPLFSRTEQIGVQETRLFGIAVSDSFFNTGFAQPTIRVPFPFAQVIPRSDLATILIHPDGGVLRIDAQNKTSAPLAELGNNNKSGFVIGDQVFLCKQESSSIYRYDEPKKRLEQIQPPLSIENLKIYWENGMDFPIAINGNNAWVIRYENNRLIFDLICSTVPDLGLIKYVQYSSAKGLLFLGTASRGFAVVRKNRVVQVKRPHTSSADLSAYYSQLELSGETILTNEGHLLGLKQDRALPPIINKFGYSLYRDGDSLIWYSGGRPGMLKGSMLHRLDLVNKKDVFFDHVPIFNVFGFARWKNDVLIGSHQGLGVLSTDSLRFLFRSDPKNPGESISFSLLEVEPGVYSMASCSGWIRFDLNSMRSDTLLKLPGYCVRSQVRIGDYIFIGTYGRGIYLYHRGKLKSIPLDKNNFLLYTHCFIPDKDGFVWMSTNRGVFKASVKEMVQGFETANNSVYYHYYGRNDGMDMTEMNGGCSPCAITLKNGIISFPSMDGLLWVDPATATPLLPDGPIHFDEIRINNRIVDELFFSGGAISHSENNIYIRLAYSAWCNPENIYLEYQLTDSAQWNPVLISDGSIIRFNNLAPGKYDLRIRKRNGFGENNFSYKTLSFSIGMAWYNHPLVYLFGVLLLALSIYQFSRYQNRKLLKRQAALERMVGEKTRDLKEQNSLLEKNNNIKTRLISIISHDIVTPLKFLTVAGRGLTEKRDRLSEEVQQETIREITDTAQELQLLSTNILNWIKYQSENRRLLPEFFNPYVLTSQVFSVLNSLAKEKRIVLSNQINPGLKVIQYTEPTKILIYNLVSNSIRYSDQGVVEVSINKLGDDGFVLIVRDNGIGMLEGKIRNILNDDVQMREISAEKRSGHGLGYLIIKDLVRWMNAKLEIESKIGVGTIVRVVFRSAKLSPSEMA